MIREWLRKKIHIKKNHATSNFSKNLLAIEMRKAQMFKNKPVYLDLLTLVLSKTVIYEFWYEYVKPKYGKEVKLC